MAGDGADLTVMVVRLGAMGDIVRVLPAVRLLRIHLPDARLHWVCDDRWAPLLRDHRDLDSVLEFPRSKWNRQRRHPVEWPALLGGVLRFRGALRGLAAALTLDFHGNFRSGVVARASGAPVRIGHALHQQKEGNRLFSTHRVDTGPERRRSRIERHLSLIRPLGVLDDVLPDAGFQPTREETREARDVATSVGAGPDRPYGILNPGASKSQAYKQPPAELLATAAGVLAERGLIPVVIHGPGELPDAERVALASAGKARLSPGTPLRVLIPLLRGARIFVGGDSGPLHLACGVGCPVVGIYGPTDPVVNAPWNVPNRIVNPPGRIYTGIKRLDRSAGGFDGIAPEEVARAVGSLLEETRAVS